MVFLTTTFLSDCRKGLMAGLTFNPAFHSAVLNTLREGVIHLALPQPEIADQPDLPSKALDGLLGVTREEPLTTRFRAAAELLTFAARNLPEAQRPQVLTPLWETPGLFPGIWRPRWEPENSAMNGVLHYLEEVTKEACHVLKENSFQLSLNIWKGQDGPSHWSVLMDRLEEEGVPVSAEQREHWTLSAQILRETDDQRRKNLECEKESIEKNCGSPSIV